MTFTGDDYGTYLGVALNERDNCRPFFHVKAIKMNGLSEKEGRPIFQDEEWVTITTPGQTRSLVSKKVTDEHKRRWPQQYQAFKAGRQQAKVGTPLESCSLIESPAMVQSLKSMHIYTVEDLASLDDSALNNVGMGARNLREKARLWISEAKDKGAAILLALEKNDEKDARIEGLEAQVKTLLAKLEKMETRKRKPADTDSDE